MAVVRPPVTGDPVQDSWADQITKAINQAGTGSGEDGVRGSDGQAGADGLNAATLYLFRRHDSFSTPPADISIPLEYNYQTGILSEVGGGTTQPFDGWYRATPTMMQQAGNYVWFISVNVSQIASSTAPETIQASAWSVPTSLTSPDSVFADQSTGVVSVGDVFYSYLYQYLLTFYRWSDGTTSGIVGSIADIDATATSVTPIFLNTIDANDTLVPTETTYMDAPFSTMADFTVTPGIRAYYKTAGGRQIDWVYSATEPDGYLIDTNAITSIDLDILPGDLSIIPVPRAPTGFTAVQVGEDTVQFSWSFNPVDTVHPGLRAELQLFDGTTWNTVVNAQHPDNSILRDGFSIVLEDRMYRVIAINILGEVSAPSLVQTFVTPVPNLPGSFNITRTGPGTARASWTYVSNFARFLAFELQQLGDDGNFVTVDSNLTIGETSILLSGLGSSSSDISYRLRAVSTNGKASDFTSTVVLTPVTPNVPDSFSFTRMDENTGNLTWSYTPNFATVSHFIIEEQISGGTFTEIETVGAESLSYAITGLRFEDDVINYRIKTVGLNGLESAYSALATFSPAAVNSPSGFFASRINSDLVELLWDHVPGMSPASAFVVEVRRQGDPNFSVLSTTDGSERGLTITGLAVENSSFDYRIKAVGLTGVNSSYSLIVTVAPPPVLAPTVFTAEAIESVGVLTTVALNWTLAVDNFNVVSQVTLQFRPVTTPASDWIDVATFSADITSGDNLPPQQGIVEYRIRVTALNGEVSPFTAPAQLFISGGSATDDAIFNGDAAFLSTQHYSVNTEDIVLTAGSLVAVEGSTNDTPPYNTRTFIEGVDGTTLALDFLLSISSNQVDRNRHFYLDLGEVVQVGTNPLDWDVDTGNVAIEILSDPADTAMMYASFDTTPPDDDRIYTDGAGSLANNTRTYNERVARGSMFATQAFTRLPMRRTFTFRDAGTACIRIRFEPAPTAHPRINFSTPLRLQAFATEVLDTQMMTGVTSAGTTLTYSKTFEEVRIGGQHANPMIFITPSANVNTWFTNRTNESVTIHADSSTGVMVDVTARGR